MAEREGTYVYLWLIHVDVWQKPILHCKAIILQLKINTTKQKRKNCFTRIVEDFLDVGGFLFYSLECEFNRESSGSSSWRLGCEEKEAWEGAMRQGTLSAGWLEVPTGVLGSGGLSCQLHRQVWF